MPPIYSDDQVTIEAFLGLGPFGNNCYVLRPTRGAESVTVIDAPEGVEQVLAALDGTPIERIVVTHWHGDHWGGFDVLRACTDAPVFAGTTEINLDPAREVLPIAHDETFMVGSATVRAIHTPGHTPGSTCFLVNGALLTGDTLFPGGPGRTREPENLQTEIASITSRLHTLPGETLVLPGHGGHTTIEASRTEYAVFASKPHAADLCGDVLWAQD